MDRMKRLLAALLTLALLVPGAAVVPGVSAQSQERYAPIDMTQDVVKARIAQRVWSDCAVVSMATIEAYLYGATTQEAQDKVYNALISANTDDNYAYWGNVGYAEFGYVDYELIYSQLAQGYPAIIYRIAEGYDQHWSVVTAYNGPTDELDPSGFTIVDVGRFYDDETCVFTYDEWATLYSGTIIEDMAIRCSGISVAFPQIKLAINTPPAVHTLGTGHNVYGYITSENGLTEVTVRVTDLTGGVDVFSRTVEMDGQSFCMADLDKAMTFGKWPEGSYRFSVSAADSAGQVESIEKEFIITAAPADYERTYEIRYDGGNAPGKLDRVDEVAYNGALTLPDPELFEYGEGVIVPQGGYILEGWNIQRSDGKWLTDAGWHTERAILDEGYALTLWSGDQQIILDDSWLADSSGKVSFLFYARWKIGPFDGMPDPGIPEATSPTEPEETLPAQPETEPTVPAGEHGFTDIAQESYYYDAVLWAVEKGITTGKTETTFDPNGDCTRKQIVTFLWRALGEPESKSMDNPFTDVKADRFEKAILWAYYEGITAGSGDGTTFSPDAPCTRKQIVTFLWRFMGQPKPVTTENPFSDVKNDRFLDPILWAYENGITTGKTETTFAPEATCSRCQIVTFLYRAYAED